MSHSHVFLADIHFFILREAHLTFFPPIIILYC
jgi:hypothetical protein